MEGNIDMLDLVVVVRMSALVCHDKSEPRKTRNKEPVLSQTLFQSQPPLSLMRKSSDPPIGLPRRDDDDDDEPTMRTGVTVVARIL
jgi:hypothetical protein